MVKRKAETWLEEETLKRVSGIMESRKISRYAVLSELIDLGLELYEQKRRMAERADGAGAGVEQEVSGAGVKDWREFFKPASASDILKRRGRR